MKKIAFLLVCLISILSPLAIHAQGDYQIPENVPANNGELDWFIYKDSKGEAKLDKKDVILKSNTKMLSTASVTMIYPSMTYANIPLNLDGDFYLSATMKPSNIDEDHLFGLVFNVANEADYHAILFDNQFCYFVRVYNMAGLTQIQGLNDRVRYKYQKAPKDMWKIAIERKRGGEYTVSLNGLEVRTIPGKSIDVVNIPGLTAESFLPCIGACVTNKGEVKITEISYEQYSSPKDE